MKEVDVNLISIVVPVYNAERFIRQTIDHILKQEYEDYELILVNDGSSDSSLSIMQEYTGHPKIRILSSNNRGAPYARNWGASVAKGEYILFFDADDFFYDQMLQKLDRMTALAPDLIMWNFDFVNEEGVNAHPCYREFPVEGLLNLNSFKVMKEVLHMAPLPDNKLYRSELIKKYNIYFDDIGIAQDVNFFYKYLSICKSAFLCAESLCAYRVVEGSVSHSFTEKILDIMKCFEYVDDFCAQNGGSADYINELWDLKVEHYNNQYWKHLKMNDPKLRYKTVKLLTDQYRDIIEQHKDVLSDRSLTIINIALKRWERRFIYLNPLYPSYVSWKNKKRLNK